MANIYRAVMRGSGITAVVVGGCYLAGTAMAVSDGDGVGVEIPTHINTVAIMVIVCTAIISGVAWLTDRGHRVAAEERIRPVVRDEIERAIADTMPLLVATVAETLDRRIMPQMHEVAVAAGRQSAIRLRDMVTTDLREIVGDAHRRAIVTGQVMQVNASASAAAGEAIGRAALRGVPRRFVSTSQED